MKPSSGISWSCDDVFIYSLPSPSPSEFAFVVKFRGNEQILRYPSDWMLKRQQISKSAVRAAVEADAMVWKASLGLDRVERSVGRPKLRLIQGGKS